MGQRQPGPVCGNSLDAKWIDPGTRSLDRSLPPTPVGMDGPSPVSLALARGFVFVVFEQLPKVGGGKIIRKVAIVPRDFSLKPQNPLGTLSPAEHVMGSSPKLSPYLSASSRPFGAPSIQGEPLLLDTTKIVKAGGRIVGTAEVVRDLKAFAAANPRSAVQINKLISTIESIEGELLVKGTTPPGSATRLGPAHKGIVKSGEQLWREYTSGSLSRPALEGELAALEKSYQRVRVAGKVGRVLTVVGLVLTAADLARATEQSVQQRSFKPIGAETIRQAGGWGGALAGAKIGAATGALFGIETGPGALVTGAVGAIVFGAAGYFGADWLADHISPN